VRRFNCVDYILTNIDHLSLYNLYDSRRQNLTIKNQKYKRPYPAKFQDAKNGKAILLLPDRQILSGISYFMAHMDKSR